MLGESYMTTVYVFMFTVWLASSSWWIRWYGSRVDSVFTALSYWMHFSCVCEKSQLSCTVCVKGGWGREFYIKNLLWASVQVQSRTSFGACELGEVGLELKFQAWARFSCGYMKTNEVSECVGCVLAVKNCESRDVTFVLHCLQPGWQICMYIYLPTLYVIRSLYST